MKLRMKIVSICMVVLMFATTATTVAIAAANDAITGTDESVSAETAAIETEKPSPTADNTKPAGGRSRSMEHKNSAHANVISVAASVLGKTTDEVKESIKDAKIGDLLIATGKLDEFRAAYLAEAKTKLDSSVTLGTLTQAEADARYADAEAKMAAYDGTTHLCGGTDHSKMSGRDKPSKS